MVPWHVSIIKMSVEIAKQLLFEGLAQGPYMAILSAEASKTIFCATRQVLNRTAKNAPVLLPQPAMFKPFLRVHKCAL